MAGFQFLLLLVLLCAASVKSAPALSLENGDILFNGTSFIDSLLHDRSLSKREIFDYCDGDFSDTLSQGINDAYDIISNAVDHLNLAISIFKDDDSGELNPEKTDRKQRTFDEHNAFVSYHRIVTKFYQKEDADFNKAGLAKLKGTRDLATTLKDQYRKYLDGANVPWTREGFPYLTMYCNDADLYYEKNDAGKTYSEANGPNNNIYWVGQSKGAPLVGPNQGYLWIPRLAVCDAGDGATTRFGVPVEKGISAYVYGAIYGLIEESMVFCPSKQPGWIDIENERTASGVHYRNMHVKIGEEPTDAQKTLANTLLGIDQIDIQWLSKFVTETFIHESTHAEAFVGPGNKLGASI
ncbi:hypothetical protein M426DRAFT_65039 [Hypoxylon sp. CI-4A]|nr:hypothetical protein M426DRAFT_65039 [Hypoxylon sp. CI-4A]